MPRGSCGFVCVWLVKVFVFLVSERGETTNLFFGVNLFESKFTN